MKSKFIEDFHRRALNKLVMGSNVMLQPRTLFIDLLGITRVADENRSRLSQNQITAVAAEAGQVTDVDRIGNEKGVDALRLDQPAQAVAPLGKIVHGRFGSRFLVRSLIAVFGRPL